MASYAISGDGYAIYDAIAAKKPDLMVWLGDNLFLRDDRYSRSANKLKDGPDKTMLGAAQLAWLRNAPVSSNAPIKLVANGSQMWNRFSRFEGWNHYATRTRGER
jgi:phosphodiesterase/alkaline phosphatase D-like protein